MERAIDSVIDVELFNAEVEAEKDDMVFLQSARDKVSDTLQELAV